ncbi:MAG TPA: glycoside hydrolase family 2, partial [Verrucomicrobiae bacterium]
LTYDRAEAKIPTDVLRAANLGSLRGPPMSFVLPDAMFARTVWKFTLTQPANDWAWPDFDAAGWSEGPAGFGTPATPGIRVNTVWKTPDIWLRGSFTLASGEQRGLKLRVFHDEDAQIYLNGVLAVNLAGYSTGYVETDISPEARAALRPGRNIVAVHCHQTTGGQGIDVGILVPQEPPP